MNTVILPSAIKRMEAVELPVVVIGAGPVGLAAAAELLERGIEFVLLEAAERVGASVLQWGHVGMFSPWRFNLNRAAVALLERSGWVSPDLDSFPTGQDLVERYLAPLASMPEIAPRLRLHHRVMAIARARVGKVRNLGREHQPLELRYFTGEGVEGRIYARAVLDATGTWSNPNPAGASGLPALGESHAVDHIRYGMPQVLGPERARYAGRRVLVIGTGHSAVGTLLDLASLADEEPATKVIWAARSRDFTRVFGGGENDGLVERGALGSRLQTVVEQGRFEIVAPFAVEEITTNDDGSLSVLGSGDFDVVDCDEAVVATGFRPDLSFLTEVRTDLDPALECPRVLAPLIDPNIHSCGTVRPHGAAELSQPEPGVFIVGMKSYGRAPTFLLATGHEQVRSIAAHLAGDEEAARRVELELPETGVCSGPAPQVAESTTSACCGPKAPKSTSACCGAAA